MYLEGLDVDSLISLGHNEVLVAGFGCYWMHVNFKSI